ncbi:uncharacterized protein [Antedon mediterranea]|uniref:uncharacterized protein n=1 Tax=Antedon mediterranea TaxID=105859 RepID=UPI003AF96B5D
MRKNAFDLIRMLIANGMIHRTNIRILIEVFKVCGRGGVESVIKPEWNLPKFEDVPITNISDHRRKLIQFGNTVTNENMRVLGQLYNIRERDPYSLTLQLDIMGYLTGDKMNEFIEKLKDLKMFNEVDALKGHGATGVAHGEATGTPNEPTSMTELTEDEFNELLTDVSLWWKKHGNINMLRVLLSEFTRHHNSIALHTLEEAKTPYDLIRLLNASGLLKPTDIDILVEATNLCGLQGVREAIVKSPNFDVPYKNFSDHRRKLIALGQQMNTDNKLIIGQLKDISVNDDTDPFWLILKLEMKGTLAEGEKIEKFIEQMTRYGMTKEVEALTKL